MTVVLLINIKVFYLVFMLSAATEIKFRSKQSRAVSPSPDVSCNKPADNNYSCTPNDKSQFPARNAKCECHACYKTFTINCTIKNNNTVWATTSNKKRCDIETGCGKCPAKNISSSLKCLKSKNGMVNENRTCICKHNCKTITINCNPDGVWEYTNKDQFQNCLDKQDFDARYNDLNLIEEFRNGIYYYSCNNGYQLSGDKEIQCVNGELKSKQPKCKREIIQTTTSTTTITPTTILKLWPTIKIGDNSYTRITTKSPVTPMNDVTDDFSSSTVSTEETSDSMLDLGFRHNWPAHGEVIHFPGKNTYHKKPEQHYGYNPEHNNGFYKPVKYYPTSNTNEKGKKFPLSIIIGGAIGAILFIASVIIGVILSKRYTFKIEKGTKHFPGLIGFTTNVNAYLEQDTELTAITSRIPENDRERVNSSIDLNNIITSP